MQLHEIYTAITTDGKWREMDPEAYQNFLHFVDHHLMGTVLKEFEF